METAGIRSYGLSVLSSSSAVKGAHAAVASHTLYDDSGRPADGGPNDLRLGTTEHDWRCSTCLYGKKQCQGHRGVLKLDVRVYNPTALKEVLWVLQSLCFSCGSILIDQHDPDLARANMKPAEFLSKAATYGNGVEACGVCRTPHPRVEKDSDDHHNIVAAARNVPVGESHRKSRIYAPIARLILLKVVGLERLTALPIDALIWDSLQVAPATMRPSLSQLSSAMRSTHEITALYQHIVKRNGMMTSPPAAPEAEDGASAGEQLASVASLLSELVLDAQGFPNDIVNAPLEAFGKPSLGAEKARGRRKNAHKERDADPRIHIDLLYDLLCMLVHTLVMGSGAESTKGRGAKRSIMQGSHPTHGLLGWLAKKTGLLRGLSLGKRVTNAARSTINGDMKLAIDEIRMPFWFARTMQFEETVQAYNIDRLSMHYANGAEVYPGATEVWRQATGAWHSIANISPANKRPLEIGDRLRRDLVNGDYTYYNRSPTLERSSYACVRIQVNTDVTVLTIRMNVLACKQYNADFDGDQMNNYLCHTPASVAEALVLSTTASNYISAKSSAPVIGQVLDSVLGGYAMTRAKTFVSLLEAMRIWGSARASWPSGFRDMAQLARSSQGAQSSQSSMSGRELISLLFADTPVTFKRQPSIYRELFKASVRYDPDEILTVISNGVVKSGVLDAKLVDDSVGSLFHVIAREYGTDVAIVKMYDYQRIAIKYLMSYSGYSIGHADLVVPQSVPLIRRSVAATLAEADAVSARVSRGELVAPLGETVRTFYERSVVNALKLEDITLLRAVLDHIDHDAAGLFGLIATGAKGSPANFMHINVCIGQTLINDARPEESFAAGRCYPYAPRFSLEPKDHGFVASNYIAGMSLVEFLFQNQAGRYDLIKKALSTAGTGHLMRLMVMFLSSAVVANNSTVAKNGRVVQTLYGDDGMDPRFLERCSFATVYMSDEEIVEFAGVASIAAEVGPVAAEVGPVAEAMARLIRDRDEFRRFFLRRDRPFVDTLPLPVNVRRLVESVLANRAADKSADLSADLSADTDTSTGSRKNDVEGLLSRIEAVEAATSALVQKVRESPDVVPAHLAATRMQAMLMRIELRPAVLLKMTDEEVDTVLQRVLSSYERAFASYGSAVGVLVAQAVAEPLTQGLLNSHKTQVEGDKSKASIGRIDEIFHAKTTAKEAAPSMVLALKAPYCYDADSARLVAATIESITLRALVESYQPLHEGSLQTADDGWRREFRAHHPLVVRPPDLADVCWRFVLNRTTMVLKAVSLPLVVRALSTGCPGGVYIEHTAESASTVVLRAWVRAREFKRQGDRRQQAIALGEKLLDVAVRGVADVIRAEPMKVSKHVVGEGNKLERRDCYVVKTLGTNLYGALLHSAVDPEGSYSCSVDETRRLYGIDAARNCILRETVAVMGDKAPNMRHLQLFASEMTSTGAVVGPTPSGQRAVEPTNTLLRMATHGPSRVVVDASLGGVNSESYGLVAPTLLGSLPVLGSNFNTYVVDETFVRDNVKTAASVFKDL